MARNGRSSGTATDRRTYRILFESSASFGRVVGRVEASPAARGVRWVVGPGSDLSEEPVCRMEAGHAGRQRRSWVSSRARYITRRWSSMSLR